MRIGRKAASIALALGLGAGGVLGTAAPAAAATYGGECGSGYGVVNSAPIGSLGTVFLTYNNSNGNNCAVAKRNSAGSAVLIEVGLSIYPEGNHWDAYEGDYFTSYAGPVYLNAAGRCVSWMGRISGTEGGDRGTNCG
ncbi:hypothetical protein SAMN05421803_11169 [Nocardiopsis flavescens]|uniref:Spore-associated protein A n=1 Tax=Nocardiopsis flavescens TaxID=758803 RepID=A0A1M6N5L4_9ACTN|nr:spore-associated protein A [Nocardiopsis flavescens]SHJ90906.1 hypothetical protein SAMN05421803_11169 [Nocardiopsis flavescens]